MKFEKLFCRILAITHVLFAFLLFVLVLATIPNISLPDPFIRILAIPSLVLYMVCLWKAFGRNFRFNFLFWICALVVNASWVAYFICYPIDMSEPFSYVLILPVLLAVLLSAIVLFDLRHKT